MSDYGQVPTVWSHQYWEEGACIVMIITYDDISLNIIDIGINRQGAGRI